MSAPSPEDPSGAATRRRLGAVEVLFLALFGAGVGVGWHSGGGELWERAISWGLLAIAGALLVMAVSRRRWAVYAFLVVLVLYPVWLAIGHVFPNEPVVVDNFSAHAVVIELDGSRWVELGRDETRSGYLRRGTYEAVVRDAATSDELERFPVRVEPRRFLQLRQTYVLNVLGAVTYEIRTVDYGQRLGAAARRVEHVQDSWFASPADFTLEDVPETITVAVRTSLPAADSRRVLERMSGTPEERTHRIIDGLAAALRDWCAARDPALAAALERASGMAPAAEQAAAFRSLRGHEVSYADIKGRLSPAHVGSVPSRDGWGHPLEFRLRVSDPSAPAIFSVRSPGADGAFGDDADIVYVDGRFLFGP